MTSMLNCAEHGIPDSLYFLGPINTLIIAAIAPTKIVITLKLFNEEKEIKPIRKRIVAKMKSKLEIAFLCFMLFFISPQIKKLPC